MASEAKWRTYERVAQQILNDLGPQLGLTGVQGKQVAAGVSGTDWEIDAKGVREIDGGIVVIECRRKLKSRIKQEELAGFAYRIKDIGAVSGIAVSPLPLQEGAEKVAAFEKIIHMQLGPTDTPDNFLAIFLNEAFGQFTEQVKVSDFYHIEIIEDEK